MMILKDSPPLNDSENNCNNCNYQKNVNDTTGAVSKKTDCPSDDQDYCDDIK